jgi:PAS domain S-box-containing protein
MNTQNEQSRLRKFWHRLIAPPVFIEDAIERRGVRLLNGLMIGLAVVAIAYEGLIILFYWFSGKGGEYIGYLYTFAALVLIAPIYWLNRTRFYRWTLLLLQLVISAAILVTAFAPEVSTDRLLFYLAIPLLLTAIYPSARSILILAAAVIAAAPLATALFEPASLEAVVVYIVPSLAVISVLLVILNRHRNANELERRREIEERERLFRAVFEQSIDAIFLVNPDGTALRGNAKAQQLLGYTAEEMQRLGIEGLTVPYERSDARNKFEWLVETGRLVDFERTLLDKDGRELPTEMHVSAIKDEDGRVVLVQAVARDIRERKERQAQVERLTMGVS